MNLFYRKYGAGQPLLILHGLFGQSDNWNTLARQFEADGFEVYTIDLRNHGHSQHSEEWNYKVMSDDVAALISNLGLPNPILMGHSMGGMTAMYYAVMHAMPLKKLIVVDIAPKVYPPHHDLVLEGLKSVDFTVIKTRKQAEEKLATYIKDKATCQFLLKNLYWKTDTELSWRFNLDVIARNNAIVGKPFDIHSFHSNAPTLFIRGEQSDYILDTDKPLLQEAFPNSSLTSIPGSGHWVHADKPQLFYNAVMAFLKP